MMRSATTLCGAVSPGAASAVLRLSSFTPVLATSLPPPPQDAFGNYVVQYVLELGHQETCAAVIEGLRGSFAPLSLQKFSSNVVERCLKLGGMDAEREVVIQELIAPTSLARLLQVRGRGGGRQRGKGRAGSCTVGALDGGKGSRTLLEEEREDRFRRGCAVAWQG